MTTVKAESVETPDRASEAARSPEHATEPCWDALAGSVTAALAGSSGILALIDPSAARARVVGRSGLDGARNQTLELGDSRLSACLSGGEPLVVDGTADSGAVLAAVSPPDEKAGSALLVPLGDDPQPGALLVLGRRQGAEPFGAAELELASRCARIISPVLRLGQAGEAAQSRIRELEGAAEQLNAAQDRLVQSEKLASVGQLAAGVAHEINNPVGYVASNLGSLRDYVADLFELLALYEQLEPALEQSDERLQKVAELKGRIDLAYLREDLPSLLQECDEGISRVKKIVQDLKDFSRTDTGEWQWADLVKGLESTLNVVWNELKYKARVSKEFAELPHVHCVPSQINQVFMNLLVNAAQAIVESGEITIATGLTGPRVWVRVTDTGSGIEPDKLGRIFEPFFTTKEPGKGTGLGLSVSYGIVRRHGGEIEVESEPGKGTTFTVWLPVEGPETETGESVEKAS